MKSPHLSTAIFCFMLVGVLSKRNISQCGQLQQNLFPLMTNSKFTSHRWPWHAAIFHLDNGQRITYQCRGTAIDSKTILTAAHCVSKNGRPMEHDHVSVSLGRLNLSDDNETSAQWPTVAKIITHPHYNTFDYSNDIAIIILYSHIKFDGFVQPICMWSENRMDFSEIQDRVGTVVGWGQTETGEPSTILRQAYLPVISPVECLQSNRNFVGRHLSLTNFCAGLRNGTNVCFGDSGGSMIFEESGIYYIRGIVSVGPAKINLTENIRNCDLMEYAIFTDVAQYLPWIYRWNYCEEYATCMGWIYDWECRIRLTKSRRNCTIVFDEAPNVTLLEISGNVDALPDISDATRKFINLEALRLTNLKLKTIDRARLTSFNRIKNLTLSSNEITQLVPDTFDDLTDLRRLYVEGNKFEKLHDNTFNGLPKVNILWLSGNQLEVLPANIFRNNQKLETVNLNVNKLKELHIDTFSELHNLKTLFLMFNRLEVLPANIFDNNSKLEEIVLDENNLKELHADIFSRLPNLKSISFRGNQLEILPANIFHKHAKLEVINLNRNKLKELHADVFNGLPNLRILSLKLNQFENLTANISNNNPNLEEIYLDGNKLKVLHANTFSGLPNLNILWLSDNQLEVLPANIFRNNKKLEKIHLDKNKLTELHAETFEGLMNLKNLALQGNQLEILPANIFRDNAKIEEIYLTGNKLKELHADTFNGLPNLKMLSLMLNQFENLPANIFHNNPKLEVIYLGGNKLKELYADTFNGLPNLRFPVRTEDVCSGDCHVIPKVDTADQMADNVVAEDLARTLCKGDIIEFPEFMFLHYAFYLGDGVIAHVTKKGTYSSAVAAEMFLDMVGTSPARVNNFKNKARQLGLIERSWFSAYEIATQGLEKDSAGKVKIGAFCKMPYHLLTNNCEMFATYCKYDHPSGWTEQGLNIIKTLLVGAMSSTTSLLTENIPNILIDENVHTAVKVPVAIATPIYVLGNAAVGCISEAFTPITSTGQNIFREGGTVSTERESKSETHNSVSGIGASAETSRESHEAHWSVFSAGIAGPSAGAGVYAGFDGVSAETKVELIRTEVGAGPYKVGMGLQADTGVCVRREKVGASLLGFGGEIGSDGIKIKTPIADAACSVM